ncbi:hypothetical protein [Microbulbifer taiwanensis]|uniref:hypothetical protein n=1 Tax=Microbulbifer taiwanensis TaxID=986746 RepID=UPI00360A6936
MSWSSDNPNVGSGSQTITASEPDSLVRTELDFGDQGLPPQNSTCNHRAAAHRSPGSSTAIWAAAPSPAGWV